MRFSTAIGVSIALHGVVAAGIVTYMKYVPEPTTLATLDLSSVELSFAEHEDETAAVAPSLPAPAPQEPPKPQEEKPPEPEMEKTETPLPPGPETAKLPEPEPERERMETPKPPPTPSPSPAPAVAPKQAKVDAPPKPRKSIRPEYPRGARQRGEQGDVVVEIRVSDRGSVDNVSVVASSGFPELDEAALRAAKAARFAPARSGKTPVSSTARLTLTFRLR